jgi:putative ABC transport system permease protein
MGEGRGMAELFKIASRNLWRYKRRTLLTLGLIVIGVVFVAVFVSVTDSFKNMMIGQITDAYIGHIQIHRKGYQAAIDTLPLNLNLTRRAYSRIETLLKEAPGVEAYSPRIKLGGMFSNFTETTNIRLNGVEPDLETRTAPLLMSRVLDGERAIRKGAIWVPELLARGMKVKVGDPVVVIATNKEGSVNGKQFVVGGILEGVTGPGGRDGYVHIEDAADLLRMEEMEISEIALRLKDFSRLHSVYADIEGRLAQEKNPAGRPAFEVHTWEKLSPFYNIARMIDLMTVFIKIMLVAIVLVSIMNVMIMAVYERVREIGTIAAMGTPPRRILSLFLVEGFLLGAIGAVAGALVSVGVVFVLNLSKINFDFGQQTGLLLSVRLNPAQLAAVAGIVVLVAVAASLQPSFKAARMDPIKALGHV